MSTMRKPLSVRNSENPSGADVAKKRKKTRRLFPLLDKAIINLEFNVILKDFGASKFPPLSEADLKEPTPERVQLIYLQLLQISFEITHENLIQAPFNPALEHKELMEDFIFRIQFFRAMKKLMHTCLETDFTMKDFMAPDSKRLCRHLSAFLNYTKFHHFVYTASDDSDRAEKEEVRKRYSSEDNRNKELKEMVATLERQRRQEQQLEEELKLQITSQTQAMVELHGHQESLKAQHGEVEREKERSESRLHRLTKELEKLSSRIEDLGRQVVTSPEKLKANLMKLRQELDMAATRCRETKEQLGMWESLASQEEHLPGGILNALNKDMDSLADKVKARNDLYRELEGKQELVYQKQQLLEEATNKQQMLQQHFRSMREQMSRLTINEPPGTQELQRDILLLEKEVQQKEMENERKFLEVEEEKRKVAEYREVVSRLNVEMKGVADALVTAFKERAAEYTASLDLDPNKYSS